MFRVGDWTIFFGKAKTNFTKNELKNNKNEKFWILFLKLIKNYLKIEFLIFCNDMKSNQKLELKEKS